MTCVRLHRALSALLVLLLATLPRIARGDPVPGGAAETILAGGALAVCSDLAQRACRASLPGERRVPMYRLDRIGVERAADPGLWAASGAPALTEVAAWLAGLVVGDRDDPLDAAALEARLAADRGGSPSPWSRMTDAERSAVRSALEIPRVGANGERLRERVDLMQTRERGGIAVLEAFVTAARERAAAAPPRIAIVTASASDPMEPVDFYEAAFTALGAEAHWWPVDAAMARARFPERDCAALDSYRLTELGIAGRERIYPDLASQAAAFCRADDGGLPEVHGVFFTGGDQWRLRRAFIDADDAPNPWLLALREAHAAGRVVVGGTSAGAAVQSGAAMLSNGSVAAAIEGRVANAAPPEPGCGRAARCPPGLGEDALTLWPAGGLGLARGAIVDTHFSERARELRLLVAMSVTGAFLGYGVDEGSALRIREWSDRREVDAIGARGGWVFARRAGGEALVAWYLAPGARLVIDAGTMRLEGIGDEQRVRRPRARIPHDALAPGALRDAAARLAWRCGRAIRMTAGDRVATLGCIDGATRAWVGRNGLAGVGPLRLSLSSDAAMENVP